MIAVIFEVEPAEGRQNDYLAIAASLADELRAMHSFISVERFQSLTTPGKLLSLSFWRDEASVAAWRNRDHHRAAQSEGRAGIFTTYRIRVAAVLRDYTLADRNEAPPDSRATHG